MRLDQLGGAPQGYWENTAKKIGKGILTAAQVAVGMPAGIINLYKDLFFGGEKEKPINFIDDITTSFVRKVNEI